MTKFNLDKLREIAEPKKLTRAEEMALEAYPRDEDRELNFRRTNYRIAYERGYKQAEKDILSKFTKEHLEGLKWIERTGISTQPVPYHKYCKDLYKVLEELLKEKYDIQGNTSV